MVLFIILIMFSEGNKKATIRNVDEGDGVVSIYK